MGTLTLASANTPYQLTALLNALSDSAKPLFLNSYTAQFVAIQADPDAGAAKFYIGNAAMSSSNYGVLIYPTQVWPIYSMESNLIQLKDIYVMCDTANKIINVTFVKR